MPHDYSNITMDPVDRGNVFLCSTTLRLYFSTFIELWFRHNPHFHPSDKHVHLVRLY